MKIRDFSSEDLGAILAIQAENPLAAQWLAPDYEGLERQPGGMILVAELDMGASSKVIGFAALHRILDEAELKNIAVAREHQHHGVGEALLREAFNRLQLSGTKRIFLEVRPSNQNAVRLYTTLGFRLHSQRKDYYHEPLEDAHVMAAGIPPSLTAKK